MDWLSNNLETIISFIVGIIGGGATGYKIGLNKKVKQTQTAGNNSSQIQIGNDYNRK